MITQRNAFLTFIGVAILALIITYAADCSRRKPVERHQENRQNILKTDSLISIVDTRYRAKLDSLKHAYQDTLRNAKENYKVIVQKDVRIEYRYRQAPSVASCDSVITSKNSRIATLESMASQQDQMSRTNDSLLASYAGSIRAKNETISQLNAGYARATQDLQQALRPKRWGIGLFVGGGVGPSLRPGPIIGAGVTYNFIRL